MPKRIDDAREIVTAIKEYFDGTNDNRNCTRLTRIANLGGGFEKWVRGEICWLFMNDPWNRYPAYAHQGLIGVEYTARLDRRSRKDQQSTQVDLWVTQEQGDDSFYVELKNAFNNQNKGKQRASWIADAHILSCIKAAERPIGWASILFGVGWDWNDWLIYVGSDNGPAASSNAVRTLDNKNLLVASLCPSQNGSSPVHLAALYGH